MAALQSMTLAERMTTINNTEHSLSDGINDFTFQEACNKWLIETGTINGVSYSGISINKYTPEEAFAIIRHKIDLRSETLDELVSELGSYYPIHKYTATEALNKKNAVLVPYSLSFDGTNDYVTISDSSLWDFGSDDFTLVAWINSANFDTYHAIITQDDNDAQKSWHFRVQTTAKLLFRYTVDGTTEVDIESDASGMSISTWYNVAFVRSSNTYTFYVNGVAKGTGSLSATFHAGSSDVLIGARAPNTLDFNGKIDEVSIFNKGLTQAEITSLYAADPQNAGDAVGITNLIGYWKFDEGTGEPQDTSGNDNHGTITGATWTVH